MTPGVAHTIYIYITYYNNNNNKEGEDKNGIDDMIAIDCNIMPCVPSMNNKGNDKNTYLWVFLFYCDDGSYAYLDDDDDDGI
jgi:hypothetical protein